MRRNVFLNWQGRTGTNFVLVGEDGKPFFEAQDVLVENNLMIGNSRERMRAAFGVKGGANITFRNNTVVGDLPALAYAFRLNQEGANPPNAEHPVPQQHLVRPHGHHGRRTAAAATTSPTASRRDREPASWTATSTGTAAQPIPPGDQVNPLVDDVRRLVADPLLNTNQAGIVLPRWTGTAFPSGSATIRHEFVRLVGLYGAIPGGSPAWTRPTPLCAPPTTSSAGRAARPDLGAYEVTPVSLAVTDVAVAEGDSGASAAAVTVTLLAASANLVTVSWADRRRHGSRRERLHRRRRESSPFPCRLDQPDRFGAGPR